MTDADVKQSILGFAAQLSTGQDNGDAESIARGRAWLDSVGRPTPEGHWLIESLVEQGSTRSTFRHAV